MILFSDGLIEQADAQGTQFGIDRVLETVTTAASCQEDVTVLHAALQTHAASESFDDDLTIASIERSA